MNTEDVLQSMLTENTGIHPMDSGGENGRMWQRNQGKDFESEPQASVLFDVDQGIEFSISLYHFLLESLDYDPAMQDRFETWVEEHSNADCSDMGDMDSFISDPDNDFSGIYSSGKPFMEYTYNLQTALDQDFQFAYFVEDGDEYVLLQIHNGADARGGMTRPKAFMLTDDQSILNFARGGVSPEWKDGDDCNDIHWSTSDGGFNWQYQGSTEEKGLEEFELSDNPEDKGKGVIYVDDGKGYCPYSGKLLCGELCG
jgi:hypothetical protein